jgi:hypothetical protein
MPQNRTALLGPRRFLVTPEGSLAGVGAAWRDPDPETVDR